MLYTAIFIAFTMLQSGGAQQSGAAQQQSGTTQSGMHSVANPPAINGTVVPGDNTQITTEHSGPAGDMRFARAAAIGGMTEVRLGQLAADKGSSEQVKQFGQKMVADHTKAGDELKSIAATNKIKLPTDLDSKHQAMVDKLSGMSGAQFDTAYVNMMVKDHDSDVTEFQQEANNGVNADLQAFAAKTLPVIQSHDRMIHDIKSQMAGGKTSGKASDRQ